MSSKAYIDKKMLFWDRRTPQSDQNPKNFQFHQKQLKFPIRIGQRSSEILLKTEPFF